jgi:parallel beta-helix repeat protein
MMKRLLLGILLLFCIKISHVCGTNYYFSVTGSDQRNIGTNQISPFQTIAKLNSLSLQPGDNVFFRRGDTLRGQVNLMNSGTNAANITFGAFGIGVNPVLSGAIKIQNWKVYSNNIYVADVPQNNGTINQLFVNGILMTLARYPNSGYLTIDSSSGNTNLTSKMLTQPSGYWANATLIARTERWVYENITVANSKGGTLSLTSPSSYAFQTGFGFFLNNKLSELDVPGEWYYDAPSKKIYIITPDQRDPKYFNIEASIYDYGFNISNQSYINITNVTLGYQGLDGILTTACNNIAVKNASFLHNFRNGIWTSYEGGTKISILNSSFSNIGNNGIDVSSSTFSKIQGNTLKRIALNAGMGGSGDGKYIGIITGSDSYIGYNTLDSIGYNGIHCYSRDTVVFNVVKNTCLIKDDGGAVYCYKSDHVVIKNNTIINSVGNGDATSQINATYAQGIYLDDSSSSCTLSQNTIVNADFGLFIHNAFNNTITQNVSYNNRYAQLVFQNDRMVVESVNVKGNTITGNTFYSLSPNQLCIYFWTYKNNIANYGIFDKNYYCNPYSKILIKTVAAPYYPAGTLQKNQLYTIEDWQQLFVSDIYSKTSKTNFGSYYNVGTNPGNIITNSSFQNKNGWYQWGSPNYSTNLDSTNKLMSGNSLKSAFSSYTLNSNGYFANGDFPVTTGNYYRLTFKANSLKTSNLNFDITQNDYPYKTLDLPNGNFRIEKDTTHFEYIFKSMASFSNARILFSTTVYDSTLWMDDVTLTAVSVADTSLSTPSSNSPIFINTTVMTKTFTLPGSFTDLDGKIMPLSITIPPYSSKIYTRAISTGSNLKNNASNGNSTFTLQNSSLTVSPVPTQLGNKIYVQYPDTTRYEKADYSITDLSGREVNKGTAIFDNFNLIEIPTNGLSQGIFIIKLITGTILKTAKIILN